MLFFPSHWGISQPRTFLIFDVRWIQNSPIHYCYYCQANTSQKNLFKNRYSALSEESHLDLATFSFAIQYGNYICRYSEGKIYYGGLSQQVVCNYVYGSTNKVGLTINQVKWKISRLSHVCCADQWINYLEVGNTVSCKVSIAVKGYSGEGIRRFWKPLDHPFRTRAHSPNHRCFDLLDTKTLTEVQ